MDTVKKYKKVVWELYSRDGYYGRWIMKQRHMRFSESDVPELFKKRPFQDEEKRTPEYRYTIEKDTIYIGLFYDGLPEKPPS